MWSIEAYNLNMHEIGTLIKGLLSQHTIYFCSECHWLTGGSSSSAGLGGDSQLILCVAAESSDISAGPASTDIPLQLVALVKTNDIAADRTSLKLAWWRVPGCHHRMSSYFRDGDVLW